MADVKIDMLLADSSGSISKRTNETKALNSELTKTQKLAKSAFVSQSASAPSGPELETYNKVRGTVGTGAGARDFANQAQGLGGVVRLYATFAANIFAVSAAFQALQQAANFERLIQGSKLMSEQTGVNLMTLGKNLQTATGYAISLEDAMQFANLGTSAGIAAKQMTSLVEIAKGAAVGLGRDVQDSVRRIIQGTAKQEQEILDELGIFIKAKDAYAKYAKEFQIEGGADALSAQQRVAAYANAVEKAGSKWKEFAQIDDPFSRLVATGKSALTELLNTINQVFKPFISFLADSKGAVMALATAISISLTRRALPELKNLFVDLFTYDKVRARAQAEQMRVEIAREMAQTANIMQAKQAELAAIATQQAVTPAVIPKAFGNLAVPGRSKDPGISTQRLTTELFKRGDISSIKTVEDAEKRVLKVIQDQIGTNAVKLEQLKTIGVVQNTSTLENVQLGEKAKRSAQELFVIINEQNTALVRKKMLQTELVALSDAQLAKQAQLTQTTPGQVTAVTSLFAPKQAPSPVSAAGTVAAATAGSALAGLMSNVAKGAAEVGASSARMATVIGGPVLVQLKSFGVVLADNWRIMRALPSSMAMVGAAGALMGTALAGAFRLIAGALGPIAIVWTLWELFGTKLMPDSWKAAEKQKEKQKELTETIENAGQALALSNELLRYGVSSNEEYAQSLDRVSNALKSQLDQMEEKIALEKKQKAIDLAKKQAKEAGSVFSPEAFAIEQLMELENVRMNPQLWEDLRNLRNEYQGLITDNTLTAEKEKELKQILDTKYKEVLKDQYKVTEQARAQNSVFQSAFKTLDESLTEAEKKFKNFPKFTDIVSSEEGKKLANVFDKIFTPVKDTKQATANIEQLAGALSRLSAMKVEGAQDLLNLISFAPKNATITEVMDELAKNKDAIQKMLKSYSELFAKFSPAVVRQFNKITAAIEAQSIKLAELDLNNTATAAFNQRIEAVRGYATAVEIAAQKVSDSDRAKIEYDKQILQLTLERDKVLKAQGAGKASEEEAQAARNKFNSESRVAKLQKDQKLLTADITAKNKLLDSILKQISIKYDSITRKVELQNLAADSSLRIEQERLRVLREASGLPEPKLVDLETAQQQKEIQNRFEQARKSAELAAKKELEELDARAKTASEGIKSEARLSAIVEAQVEQRARLTEKERDAIRAAEIRMATDLEILKISSEQKKVYAELAEVEKKIAQQETIRQITVETENQLLDIKKQELQFKLELGTITQQLYDSEIKGIERTIRASEYKNKQLEIEAKYQETLRKIEADKQVIYANAPVDETGMRTLTGDQINQIRERTAAATAERDARISGLKRVYEANETLRSQMESLTADQKGLANIYKDTFSSMSDAIVQFVRTGKMSFKDLINDMLANILRLYLNKVFMGLFSSMLGGGFLPGVGPLGNTGAGTITGGSGLKVAKGMAFDTGITRYAKGGMFTNSIVNQPTLFRFAKGTGLMGEAGPEAIMPLKRDPQGNLGVRANGGNVEVVVNNYGSEKAETRETVDSRGNRRIEVVVGDMTAGEVSRGGSSTNRSMRNTFGLQPQLIRR